MNQININAIIEFIGDFFSELPPQALAIIISVITLTLYVAGGILVASSVGFLALSVTHNGPIVLSICVILVAITSIYGITRAIQNYKKIIQSYENNID